VRGYAGQRNEQCCGKEEKKEKKPQPLDTWECEMTMGEKGEKTPKRNYEEGESGCAGKES